MKKNDKTIKARVVFTKQDSHSNGIQIYISNKEKKPRRKPPIETRPVRGRSTKMVKTLISDKKQQSEL